MALGQAMSKTFCPGNCGKRFINEDAANQHADMFHPDWRTPKRRGWCTPYGFGDWKEPITYEEACEQMAVINQSLKDKFLKQDANLLKSNQIEGEPT